MSHSTNTQQYSIHPYAAALPVMSEDDLAALTASIQRNGMHEPIRLYNKQILDGRHRYQACLDLGITPKILPWEGEDEAALAYVMAMNVNRRALSVSQRAILAARAAPLEKGQNKGPMAKKTDQKILTQDEAAQLFGVSPDSIQRARYVLRHGDQELIARIERDELSVNAAKEEILAEKAGQPLTGEERKALDMVADIKAKQRDLVRKQMVANVKTLNAKNLPLKAGNKRYSVILADPPWNYGPSASGSRLRIERHYPTMSLEAICALPVEELANPNAMLFLWCPSPLLPDGLEVMRAWGFDYVASAVWTKSGRLSHMGGIFRVHHELLLIGRRGTGLPKPDTDSMVSSVITAPVTQHSAKPTVVHQILEQLYPEFDGERIELFARTARNGWDVWGNQADNQPKAA
jgi:N6-adenosine-specific RNA methylase IME4/ParB-like chromosome segregation protein Spo0J